MSRTNLTLAYSSVRRRHNARVAQVHLSNRKRRFLGMKIGDELHLLRFKYDLAAAFCFGRRFIAV